MPKTGSAGKPASVGEGSGADVAVSGITETAVSATRGVGEFAGVNVGSSVGKGVIVGLGVLVGTGEAGGPIVGSTGTGMGVQVGGTIETGVTVTSVIGSTVGARLAAVGITVSGVQAGNVNKNKTINKLIFLIRHLRDWQHVVILPLVMKSMIKEIVNTHF